MATIKYLLTQDSDSRWGLTINTIGIQDIAAGSVYPVGDHPEDYQFSPQKGRVLREAQIVYITKGGGWFESVHQPRTKLRAGDAVVLYPYEWHSYAPDPETGWSEAWIGFAGEVAGTLLRKFFPDKSSPIYHVGLCDTLFSAYEQAYDAAEKMLPAYQQQLIGYVGLIITTVYSRSLQLPYLDNPDMTYVNLAIKYMRQHFNSSICMEDVAVLEWEGRIVFCVNNTDVRGMCWTETDGTEHKSSFEQFPYSSYPFLRVLDAGCTSVTFLDAEGNELPAEGIPD